MQCNYPIPRPAASASVPGIAPGIVPMIAYREQSRIPTAAPTLGTPIRYRLGEPYTRSSAVLSPAAPPLNSRGWTQRTNLMSDDARPREVPKTSPRATSRASATASPAALNHEEESYKLSTPEFDRVAHDPLDPPKRYHTGIFIETEPDKRLGTLFHVTGDVIANRGMRFEVIENYIPESYGDFHRTTEIGWIRKSDFPRIRDILEGLPRPSKQQGIDFWTKDPERRNKLAWTKANGDIYGPDEERTPVMKCNEWTHEVAIPMLRDKGILRDSGCI